MISFVVIGKNEGVRLTKCFESIFLSINKNSIEKYEIIYVDSRSTDDSLERASQYSKVKIYSITGVCNAAIARNVGGKEAKGDILFFLDGDMELQSDFIPLLFNSSRCLIYPFISGIVMNYNYNAKWVLESIITGNRIEQDTYEHITGGFFIITKELWQQIGGMDTRLTRGQDLDLGLRLSKISYPLLRLAHLAVNHNTISYTHSTRIWSSMFSGRYTAILIRKNIFNKHYIYTIIRTQYTLIILIISLLLMFFYSYFLNIYSIFLLLRSTKNGVKEIPKLFLFYWIRDIILLFSSLFYYPSRRVMSYKRI